MSRISATFRIALGISSLSVSIVLLAAALGLVPDRRAAEVNGRVSLCESLAVQCSLLARHQDIDGIQQGLMTIVLRNEDLVSAAVRRSDGTLLAQAGPHSETWQPLAGGKSTENRMLVPIHSQNELWGDLEAGFQAPRLSGPVAVLFGPLGPLTAFIAAAGFFINFVYLRKVLQQLDPSQAIPDRVRDALDTLAEGLLVMDHEQRIVLANEAFGKTFGQNPAHLVGQNVSTLPWIQREDSSGGTLMPWVEALQQGIRQTGQMVELAGREGEPRTFLVNCAPILAESGISRGVLASFDDITPMEKKKAELNRMLSMLQKSSEEISRQNRELERLATIDPLTSCLNRRAFFERFGTEWSAATRDSHPVTCIMLDIDHFKSINDNHGHATGDDVLRKVAETIRTAARDGDLVCRYGGEEFCVLLPRTCLSDGARIAEGFRIRIEELEFDGLRVTASFGASSLEMSPASPEELLDQADRALYIAKKSGRNQVMRADELPAEEFAESKGEVSTAETIAESADLSIPFHAVTALISALAYRDQATAEHSRRVADLAVALGHELGMTRSECYVLEIAGLLHDIGKIGVPDSILLKPGSLTPDEWKIMRTHDRIGVEIIEASFHNPSLSSIIRNHHAFFGGSAREPGLPTGFEIPVGARILTVCDSYDAIISDRVYRRGRSADDAFDELRRCAGTQFDPQIVERFVDLMRSRRVSHAETGAAITRGQALAIGLQLERLSAALDDQDLEGLRVLAHRLNAVAAREGIELVAERAARLEASVESDSDLLEVLGMAHELLDLCRSTQRSWIDAAATALS